MESLKKYLLSKGIFPKISFEDKEPHTFEVVKGKEVKYEDGSTSYKMLVKEGDNLKVVTSPSVLSEIQDCQPGDVWRVQLRYRQIGGKPFRDYIAEKIKSGSGQEKEGGEEDVSVEEGETAEE